MKVTVAPSTYDGSWWLWAFAPGHALNEDEAVGEEGTYVGKWMLMVARNEIDAVWATVAGLTEAGQLAPLAKMSTAMQVTRSAHPNAEKRQTEPDSYVVIAYAEDWRDTAELRRMVSVLRDNDIGVGPRSWLNFKRDTETYNLVYQGMGAGSPGRPPNPSVWTAEPGQAGTPVRLYTKWLGGRTYLDGSNDAEVVRQIEERWPS